MKILDIFKITNSKVLLTDIFSNNTMIVVKNIDFNTFQSFTNGECLKYESLINIDVNTKKYQEIKYDININGIAFQKSKESIYVANLEYIDNEINVHFFRLVNDIQREEKICTLSLPKNSTLFRNSLSLICGCLFYSINNQYAIFGYSEKNSSYANGNRFDKLFLIDSKNKKKYAINSMINDSSLLKLESTGFNIIKVKENLYLTVKIGAISTYEKQDIFLRKKNTSECLQNNEALYLFELDMFIKCIIENKDFLMPEAIIEETSNDKSLEIIGINNQYIIYVVTDFKKNNSCIKKYNIITKNYELVKNIKIYDEYYSFNDNIYGTLKNKDYAIYNLKNKNEVLRCDFNTNNYKVVYIDDEKVVLQVYNAETHQFDIIVIDIKSKNTIDKFQDRQGKFHKESQMLILYK